MTQIPTGKVSTFVFDVMKESLKEKYSSFQGGQIKTRLKNWQKLTSDKDVLQTVKGAKIDFTHCVEENSCFQRKFNKKENEVINKEINSMLKKGIIRETLQEEDQFVSPIFLVEKKDTGKFRMILNLKRLNEKIEYKKFKMETVYTALQLITKNCYLASIDLRDAYYSVPVHPDYQRYLKFQWEDKLYCFQVMPMGLGPVPRKFTKLTKPILSYLHDKGHVVSSYIDDSLLVGKSEQDVIKNVQDTVEIFDDLGFSVHDEKSQFIPVQEIEYLGFIINSNDMTVTLTEKRKQKLIDACQKLKTEGKIPIRQVAACIGLMVSSFLAIPHGPLFYRELEKCKIKALKEHKGNWDEKMTLAKEAKNELVWWCEEGIYQNAPIHRQHPTVILHTDSSTNTGWGAIIKSRGVTANGHWDEQQKQKHINELELLAVKLGLLALLENERNTHVRIMSDNTTTVSCINSMGSNKGDHLNNLCKDIWLWCIEREIWISAAHVAGKENIEADKLSRCLHVDMEWKLDSSLLSDALKMLEVKPCIDLFASSANAQFSKYVSFVPDKNAYAVDAFTMRWNEYNMYCFPPFSLLPRVLSKIQHDKATGVVVVPEWRNQPFWPMLMDMLIDEPVRLSARETLLQLPANPKEKHPLRKNLALLVCHVSGQESKVKDFQKQLQNSSCRHGDQRQKNHTMCLLESGKFLQIRSMRIRCHRL